MSVHPVAEKTVEILETGKYPFVILNFANPDMVIPFNVSLLTTRSGTRGFMMLL